ncbi:MAG: hypothetical protein ACI8Y7_000670 [Candidatus Woesearchaeota archaeon]
MIPSQSNLDTKVVRRYQRIIKEKGKTEIPPILIQDSIDPQYYRIIDRHHKSVAEKLGQNSITAWIVTSRRDGLQKKHFAGAPEKDIERTNSKLSHRYHTIAVESYVAHDTTFNPIDSLDELIRSTNKLYSHTVCNFVY